jgi:predicted KAP-like P-loop ATPase
LATSGDRNLAIDSRRIPRLLQVLYLAGSTVMNSSPHATVWRDDPIKSASEDTLGRSHVARRAAELVVETHSWESSVVIGLIGPWGSGKSSVLGLAIEELKKSAPEWKVVRFTPWAAGDTNGMLAEFYAAIASALPEKRFEKFRSGLADVIEVSSPAAALVPHVGVMAKGGAQWFSKWLRRQKPWAESFTAASATLKGLRTPVLVVADDIDRLQGDELLGFLKVVRLVGRFAGISYLLAYDEESLRRTIETSSNGVDQSDGSHAFLEKFVQYPIYLPPLLPGQALRQIDLALSEALAEGGHRIEQNDGRLASIGEAWTTYLDTPRAIKRFGAQLRLVLPLHRPDEIDVIDLILLTLLRMYFPAVYESLPRHRQRLVGWEHRVGFSSPTSFDWTGILDASSDHPGVAHAVEILRTVFPIIRYPSGVEAERPRASHREYFDRYFSQSVPEHDVSDHDAYAALAAASGGDSDLLRSLLSIDVGDRIDTAISKLWTFSVKDGPRAEAVDPKLLAAVMESLPTLPGRTNSILNQQQRVARWVRDLVRALPSDIAYEDVEAALRSCPDLQLIVEVMWLASDDDHELAPAVLRFREEIVSDVLDEFMKQLALKEDAPLDHRGLTMANFLGHFGAEKASERIKAEVGQGFAADDYAARFVSLSYTISENPIAHLSDFATESFQTLTSFDDEFFHQDKLANVDRDDVSWANRKAFARGRAHPRTD